MAMSYGQDKATGHSHGDIGHGGIHRIASHGSSKGSPGSSPHVQGHSLGHTNANEHGGSFPMGC